MLFIETWNVRGTYEEGALKNLTRELEKYKADVVVIQETKQRGMGVENYIFFNSGNENIRLGTGFMLHKKLKAAVMHFNAIFKRTCRMRIQGKVRKVSIINVHPQTEVAED